ncbi:LysM peptidoglycan-binding domain-containing protein [Pseudomonas japonica]|uniref:LysM peptidoglycan-binding domain-containing protein n=1 Tax=Pseudomonas japonica TaxID=256466 RepID=UPI00380A6832
MVAVVSGNGLGLFNTSLNILGGAAGSFGQGTLGQAGGKAWVNASSGNLILRFTDEQLAGLGQDLFHTRTYNTQGALSDADADGWRWDGERRLVLAGTALAVGSSLTRTTGDGHQTTYTWNGSRYQSSEGDGAHDFIQWDAQSREWYWTDGSTRSIERYNGSSGLLASVRDGNGTLITYGYQNDKLSSVSDSSGQALLMVYNAAGKLERVDTRAVANGPLSRQVYYEYDAAGRLTRVQTDLTPDDNSISDGNVYATRYTYDGSSFRIASISQSDGSTASFSYELVGSEYRVKTVTDLSGTTTFSYDLASRRTAVRNALGQEWGYVHDAKGQLTVVQSPAENGQVFQTAYSYDADGNVIRVNSNGSVLSYAYDERGNRILERDPLGVTVTRVFSAGNQLLNEIRYSLPATWNTTSASWDEPPASAAQVTRYVYDTAERLRFVVGAAGNVLEYRYDAKGLRTQEIAYGDLVYPLASLAPAATLGETGLSAWAAARDMTRARIVGMTYDYRGNLNRRVLYATADASGNGVIDAAAEITEYVYSAHGQLLQTLAVRGSARTSKVLLGSTTYDGMGRVLGQMDADGTRTTVYDGSKRSIAVTTASGLTLTQLYDTRGRLIAIQETAAATTSRITRYYYDAAGRLSMKQDAAGVRSYLFYDTLGRLAAEVDGTGSVTRHTYNANDQRLTELRYATQVDTSTWFDGSTVTVALAQVLPAASSADRQTRYTYDKAGRLASSIDAVGTPTSYAYDGRGQLVRQQTGERVTRTFYDAAGRQVGQLDSEGFLRESRYNAAGQLQQVIRYAAVTNAALRAGGSLAELRPGGAGLSNWYFYDGAGRQIGSVDERQFVSETVYDEAGNVRKNIVYARAYSAALNATSSFATVRAAVIDGGSQVLTTTYDALGRVSRRTAADGTLTTFEYDASGRLVRETAAAGTSEERSVRTRYDVYGQTLGKLLGEASTRITAGMSEAQIAAVYSQYGMTWSYDASGRVASVSDAMGNRTLSFYDAAGRLTRVINALGEVSETKYNAFGDAVERTQLGNRLASTSLAALSGGPQTVAVDNLVAAIRNASIDSRTTHGYDRRGLLLTSIDAEGISTTQQYDQYGQVLKQIRVIASGRTVTTAFAYDLRGQRISQTRDAGGLNLTSSSSYDAYGRLVGSVDATGAVSTTQYLDSGRTLVTRDPLNRTRRSEFDALGRVLKEVDALGQATLYSYDDASRSMLVTLADGAQVSTWKTRHGETLKVSNGNGEVTQYEYNRDGQLVRTLNALGQVAEIRRYDKAARLSESVDARGVVTRLDYDAASRVIQRSVDPTGLNLRTTYEFDTSGRQVRVVENAGTPSTRTTEYRYDRKGQLKQSIVDPAGQKLSTSYSYDGTGNLLSVSLGTVASPAQRVTQYLFDNLGRRLEERVDPQGLNLRTQYQYDAEGRIARKIDAAGGITDYVHDQAGQLRFTVDALGYVSERIYDAAGNLAQEMRYTNKLQGARDVATLQTLLAPAASNTLKPTLVGAGDQRTRYLYDAVGRLKSLIDPAGYSESYSYDAAGNRISLTNKNGQVWNYRYDKLGRLFEEITPVVSLSRIDSAGTVTRQAAALVTRYTYDGLGNILSRSEGRLRSSASSDPALDDVSQARTSSYAYDALGRQVRITSPGWYNKATAQYQQASDGTANTFQVTTEVTYDGLGNAVRNRVRINNSGVLANDYVDSYKAYDVLGRVRYEVDALKGVTAYEYNAFGQVTLTRRHASALNAAVPVSGYYQLADFSAATLPASAGNDRTLITRYDRIGRKSEVQQDFVSLYSFTGNVATSALKTVAPTRVYSYNALGQVIRETLVARDSTGASVMEQIATTHYYDPAGQRIGTVDALGYYTRMEYDGNGKVTRQVEYATALASWSEAAVPTPAGNTRDRSLRFVYDAAGRLVQTIQEKVSYWQQSFAANAARATMTLVKGDVLVSRSSYDGVGNVRTLTDAAGNVTSTEYNALGQVTKVTEPVRATAKAGVANPFETPVSAAPTIQYGVDAFGQVVHEQRSAGAGQVGLTQITRSLYDAAGHLLREYDAAGSVQNFKVDVAGRRLEETRVISTSLTGWRSNNQTLRRSYSYDRLGQQLGTTDWYTDNGVQKSTSNTVTYNLFGEVTAELLNGNAKARYEYNRVGHVTRQTNAQGVTQVDYDLSGKASRSAQLGNLATAADDRVTYIRNDVLGRALEQHLPAFEANVNVDTLNNLNLTLTTPIIRLSNDRWGNVLTRTDTRGKVTTYSYDHNNRLLAETLPVTDILRENGTSYRASLIHEKRYDALGQLIEEADLVGATLLRTRQHVYNQAGDLVRDIDALGVSRYYAVDAHGNRVGTRDPLGVVTYDEYDAMDRHTRHGVVRNGQKIVQLTNQYDQAGRLYAEITGATTVTETLTSTANADGSSTLAGVAGNTRFTLFDERGNIVRTRNESNIQKTFVFSEANRKVAEIDGLGNSLTWTYNEADYGRLTVRTDLSKQTFNYSYNAFGQLSKETNPAYYQGELISSYQRTYEYYGNGLLKSIRDEQVGSLMGETQWSVESYQYDQAGQRLRESSQSYYKNTLVFWIEASGQTDRRFKFDELGRLKEVKAPAGQEIVGFMSFSAGTGRVDALRYDYDELGNRRRAYMDTTNQSGGRTVIDDWYRYDLEGRVLVGKGYQSNGRVLAGKAKGYAVAYDAAGRRLSSEEWSASIAGGERYARSTYSYNDMGQVLEARSGLVTRAAGADASAAVLGADAEKVLFRTTYDELGNRSSQMSYTNNVATERSTYRFRGDGQMISQVVAKISAGAELKTQANYFGEAGMIDAAGNQASYRYVVYGANGVSVSYRGKYVRTFALFDTYKEQGIEVTTNISSTPGWNSTSFDVRGNATGVMTYNGSILNQGFAANKEGLLTARQGTDYQRTQSYLYYQGAALANYGNLSAAQITDTLSPISEEYPGRTPGNYVVSQGDTLASIAQAVWGDSKMWYLIADANGIDPSKALVVGDSIRIPNVVSSTHNDSTTFKPYNASDVLGDTTPTPVFPPPPKPKKKKCGGIAAVVMVVVAVVVAVYTAGAGAAAFASASSATVGAAGGYAAVGTAALTGGAITGISTGALVGGAIVGAAAGSAAAQLTGMAMGTVDQFSWRQVAASGLTAGIAAGAGALARGAQAGSWIKTAAEVLKGKDALGYTALGVFNYASSQVANRVVGLDSAFSWGGLAASALAANISGQVVRPGVGGLMLRGQVAAHANAFIKDKWFGADKPDYSSVAADAFGNVLANFAFSAADTLRKLAATGSGSLASSLAQGPVVELPATIITPDPREPLFDFDAGSYPWYAVGASSDGQVYDALQEAVSAVSYKNVLNWSGDARSSLHAALDPLVAGADNPLQMMSLRVARGVSNAALDLLDSSAVMAGLVTDTQLRGQALEGLSQLGREVWNNPGGVLENTVDATGRYLRDTDGAQIAEDGVRFLTGTLAGGLALRATSDAAGAVVRAGVKYYRNSVYVPPALTSGTLGGGIYIPSLGKRITTVTKAMSDRFQGNGYLDPFSNKLVAPAAGEVLAVDHIFPVSRIIELPGFKTLTRSQMRDIIQDRVELGNLQPLPQSFNASKSASLDWKRLGGEGLNDEYIENLRAQQRLLQERISEQIQMFNRLNKRGR